MNSKRIWTFEQNSLKMLNSNRKYLFIGKLHALVEFKTKIRIFYFHVHWSTCEGYHYFIEPRLNIALCIHQVWKNSPILRQFCINKIIPLYSHKNISVSAKISWCISNIWEILIKINTVGKAMWSNFTFQDWSLWP